MCFPIQELITRLMQWQVFIIPMSQFRRERAWAQGTTMQWCEPWWHENIQNTTITVHILLTQQSYLINVCTVLINIIVYFYSTYPSMQHINEYTISYSTFKLISITVAELAWTFSQGWQLQVLSSSTSTAVTRFPALKISHLKYTNNYSLIHW